MNSVCCRYGHSKLNTTTITTGVTITVATRTRVGHGTIRSNMTSSGLRLARVDGDQEFRSTSLYLSSAKVSGSASDINDAMPGANILRRKVLGRGREFHGGKEDCNADVP